MEDEEEEAEQEDEEEGTRETERGEEAPPAHPASRRARPDHSPTPRGRGWERNGGTPPCARRPPPSTSAAVVVSNAPLLQWAQWTTACPSSGRYQPTNHRLGRSMASAPDLLEPAKKKIKTEQNGQDADGSEEWDAAQQMMEPPMALQEHSQELQDVLGKCLTLWGKMCSHQGHPLFFLQDYFKDEEVKKSFVMSALGEMQKVHPKIANTCMDSIKLEDAKDLAIGASGECHLLNVGLQTMKGVDWPVFLKGPPPTARLLTVWKRALLSGKGLDLTSRSLKLCVAHSECEGTNLWSKLMFAGYTNGSTLGLGSFILLWMLAKIDADGQARPWQLPEVQNFMRSIARVKATFLVYDNPDMRRDDAWRAPAAS